MAKKEEKILTRDQVKELGLDKVSVITADMLKGYISIRYRAFCDCTDLISIEIPNSVTSIGEDAFCSCKGLKSITIPNSVTSIGKDAFAYCSSLTSIEIPSSITSIETGAFWSCSSLTSIEIPSSITSIENWTFWGCKGLKSVTIPSSVTRIGNGAFCDCNSLTSIEIPNSVTSIGTVAFRNCDSLTSLIFGDKSYKNQVIENDKCKAYKAFNANMTCKNFQYEEGKTYELDDEPILCHYGFHACLNLADVFNYYKGTFKRDIVVHEVVLEDVSDKRKEDSKVVAKKITIGKRIL